MTTRGIHTLPVEGQSNDWITPREFIEGLGPFDLDPCASLNQPWPCAAKSYTYMENGLAQPWEGFVWLNPPYSSHAAKWLAKLAKHNNGIALVPARMETAWFRNHVWPHASGLLFPAGRIKFHRPTGEAPPGNAGHTSVFVGYGSLASVRLHLSGIPGTHISEWTSTKEER